MMGEIGKKELRKLAEDIHAEGYFYSEAYPLKRWDTNGWPDVGKDEYRILDAYLLLLRLLDEYNGKDV